MKYIKKPTIIEAIRVPDVVYKVGQAAAYFYEQFSEFPQWLEEARDVGRIVTYQVAWKRVVEIDTPEGKMVVYAGDWIIRENDGELRPCKNSVFKATYEKFDT